MASDRRRSQEIDAVKGIAIIGVILGHAFSYASIDGAMPSTASAATFSSLSISNILTSFTTFSALTTQQVVPIFILVMAINYANSFRRRQYSSLNEVYCWSHMKQRLIRFLIPFSLVYIASIMSIAILFSTTGQNYGLYNPLLLVGYLPVNGPGNYFLPLIFEFLLIFPLIYYAFKRWPTSTVTGLFAIGISNEIILSHSFAIYQNSLLRLLPLIGIGLLISEKLTFNLRDKLPIFIFGPFSILYLLIIGQFSYSFSAYGIYFVPLLNAQKLFASFYVAIAVILLITTFSSFTRVSKPIAWIGKRSYAIFLAQILLFGTVAPRTNYTSVSQIFAPGNIMVLVIDILLSIFFGALVDFAASKIINAWSSRAVKVTHESKQPP